jgi:hypothetical protein
MNHFEINNKYKVKEMSFDYGYNETEKRNVIIMTLISTDDKSNGEEEQVSNQPLENIDIK